MLSLLVHLIAILFIRPPLEPADQGPAIVHVVHVNVMHIARVQTPPPATPTPLPQPSAAPSIAPHRVAAKPVSASGALPVAPPASAAPASAPSPTAHPTATPNCAKNDTPVLVAATPPPPDIPAAARAGASAKGGITSVRVVVGSDGSVAQTNVTQSSGDSALDEVALKMARSARYTAATHACKPVASEYAYTVQFAPW